jgi:hypothetical protein
MATKQDKSATEQEDGRSPAEVKTLVKDSLKDADDPREVKEWAHDEAAMDEVELEDGPQAGLVPVGTAYPRDFGHQRLQSVTSASSANDGLGAYEYEDAARGIDVPERDGVHVIDEDGKAVSTSDVNRDVSKYVDRDGDKRDDADRVPRKRVYYKTFRIGIPAGAGLSAEQHESNMRQTVEEVLKSGERVAAPVKLHSMQDDEQNHNVLMTYVAELD